MKAEVFWRDQCPRPDDLPLIEALPSSVDVAIVGSGYTGLTAARTLLKAGASVLVLEKETIGWGASSRNGGMASPGLKQGVFNIYKKYGPEYGREFWRASVDAIELIDTIVQEEQIDCDWSRDGHIALAYKPSHVDKLQKYGDWIEREFNHPTQFVSQADLKDEIGTDAYFGGLADPISGGLQPARYVFGLARAVTRAGGLLCEHTAVTQIQKKSTGFEVQTARGTVRAKEVILASNGYSDGLIPKFQPKLIPIGSYIIVTEPLPAALQDQLSPRRRMFYDSKWFIHYFRLTPDGRMLWGGRNDLRTNQDPYQSAEILSKQMLKVFPTLQNFKVTHSWSGNLGVPFDLMPHIGQVNGVHYACGYAGHGLSIATYLGTELGLLMSGEKSRSPFEEIPHPTRFFYRKRPWFLPLAAKYYRFLDRIS